MCAESLSDGFEFAFELFHFSHNTWKLFACTIMTLLQLFVALPNPFQLVLQLLSFIVEATVLQGRCNPFW